MNKKIKSELSDMERAEVFKLYAKEHHAKSPTTLAMLYKNKAGQAKQKEKEEVWL